MLMKIIKIGADWCNGCLVMKPRWKEIERELPNLKTEYLDYDSDKKKLEQYNISEDDTLPIFIFIDGDGNELVRLHGEIEKDKILELIEQYEGS